MVSHTYSFHSCAILEQMVFPSVFLVDCFILVSAVCECVFMLQLKVEASWEFLDALETYVIQWMNNDDSDDE